MRVSRTIVGLLGAVAGAATAVTGYQHVAAVDPDLPSSTTALPAVGRPLPAAPTRIRVRLAGCRAPARLVHGVCVTTVTRTRVVLDPAPPQPAPPQPADVAPVRAAAPVRTQPTPTAPRPLASSPAPAAGPRHEDDAGEDHGDDHGEDRGEDHGEEHGDD